MAAWLCLGLALLAADIVFRPGPGRQAFDLLLERGAHGREVGALLEARGAVRDARLFRFAASALGFDAFKAGKYRIAPRESLFSLISRFAGGDVILLRLTVPEGVTLFEALRLIEGAEGLTGKVTFRLEEGALLPETYFYAYGSRRDALVSRMKALGEKVLARAWRARVPGLPLASPHEALILASVVEKESALSSERPRIAGVFLNRLRAGMRLEADPTVIYGLTGGRGALRRPLRRSELTRKHPWNTYVIRGLPKGPICLPGRASIEAVVNPQPTRDLFFVADGGGGHVFAETYRQHLANVKRWRKIQAERRR